MIGTSVPSTVFELVTPAINRTQNYALNLDIVCMYVRDYVYIQITLRYATTEKPTSNFSVRIIQML